MWLWQRYKRGWYSAMSKSPGFLKCGFWTLRWQLSAKIKYQGEIEIDFQQEVDVAMASGTHSMQNVQSYHLFYWSIEEWDMISFNISSTTNHSHISRLQLPITNINKFCCGWWSTMCCYAIYAYSNGSVLLAYQTLQAKEYLGYLFLFACLFVCLSVCLFVCLFSPNLLQGMFYFKWLICWEPSKLNYWEQAYELLFSLNNKKYHDFTVEI